MLLYLMAGTTTFFGVKTVDVRILGEECGASQPCEAAGSGLQVAESGDH